jgi:hypothetical protein
MGLEPHEPSVAELKARICDLEMLNGQNNMALAVAFGLTPILNNLLGLLLAQLHVTDATVAKFMPKVGTGTKILVCRLRKHLKPYGVVIQSKRAVGYWLDEETKERIREKAYLDPKHARKPNCPPQEAA